jgi:hypothetical protein
MRDAYAIPVERIAETWPEVLADYTVPACPYQGLQVFTRDDAEESRRRPPDHGLSLRNADGS